MAHFGVYPIPTNSPGRDWLESPSQPRHRVAPGPGMKHITLYNALYKYSIQYNYIIIIKKIILFLYCIFLQYKNSIILNNLSKFLTNYRSKIKYLNFLNIKIRELGTFQVKIWSKKSISVGQGKDDCESKIWRNCKHKQLSILTVWNTIKTQMGKFYLIFTV